MPTDSPLCKTLEDLEWGALVERLSGYAVSPAAAERLKALHPAETLEAARARAAPLRDLMTWMGAGEALPVRPVPDIGPAIDRLTRAAVLSAEECLDCVRMLEQANDLRTSARSMRLSRPSLSAAIDSDEALQDVLVELRRCVEPEGRISDAASAPLGRARHRADDAKRTLLTQLNRATERYRSVLRDHRHVEIDGRYALPVRSDAEFKVEGFVLGTSSSGGTLYIEPREVTECTNRLKVLDAEVEREVTRVLTSLSNLLGRHGVALGDALEACLRADELNAIARWANATRAVVVQLQPEPVLQLRAMRHPLLLEGPREAVANDLSLRAGTCLVLSGPNAGGKTVALKCLGLAALMARAGLPVPAAPESVIGWFDPVTSDIGDAQSLSLSLSTFTAHIGRLADCLHQAQRGALFLLDEVAAGTDPDQGAALAASITRRLVALDAAVAVTTHYGRLKRLGETEVGFENASVGFNVETMQPTFKVTLGSPGASAAFVVAERHGIPHDVVEAAKQLLPQQAVQVESLITRLEHETETLAATLRAAQADKATQAELRQALEEERRTVRAKERSKLEREAQSVTAALRQARTELRAALERLGKAASASELREVAGSINAAAARIALGSEVDRAIRNVPAATPDPSAHPIEPGTEVLLTTLNTRARVLEAPHRGHVKVSAGAVKLTVPLDAIRAVGAAKRSAGKPVKRERHRAAFPVPPELIRTRDNTCDVRGLRADEALERIDAFSSRLVGEGASTGFVLHGHGTGALKLAIRKHARTLPCIVDVQAAPEAQGGDAFTVLIVG